MLAGGLGPDNVRAAIDAVQPWAVDAASQLESRAGRQGSREGARLREAARAMTQLRRLRRPLRPRDADPGARRARAGWRDAQADESFRAELDDLARLRGPPDAAHARGALRSGQAHLPEAGGSPPHRRAQAQQRARPSGARAAARQAADRRRDRRGPARRRDRDRVRALRLRLRRVHGRGGHAPPAAQRRAHAAARRRGDAGRLRHEDVEGGDERGDPRLDHERRDDALPHRLLRRPGAVPGARRASCSP